MAGPFDEYFEQVKQRDVALAATKLRMSPVAPENAASGLAAAKELGTDAGKVLAFQDHFADLLTQKRATTALTNAPKLSDWLNRDPVKGGLAKDDLENLTWFEKGFYQFAEAGGIVFDNAANLAVNRGGLSVGQAYNQAQAVASQRRSDDRKRSLGEIIYDSRDPILVDGKEFGRRYAEPDDLFSSLYRYGSSRWSAVIGVDDQAEAARYQIGKIDGNAPFSDQISKFADVITENPLGFGSFLLETAAESLPSIAAGARVGIVTRSPTAAAATMGTLSGAREYSSTVNDVLAASNHDLTTEEGALAALNDPELLASAQ